MKGVIYARYSSDNQREESIDGQLRECTAFAEKQGIIVVDTYVDRALSAKTDNRPSFQKMISDSAKGTFDVIIVWKLDRFARNRYDSAHYKAQLRKNGVRVISATESISEGAEGIILESVLEGMAEYYSAELAEKVIRGQTENAMKCKFNGGSVPLGYKVGEDRKLHIDEETAPFILYAFNCYDNGMLIEDIVNNLYNKGFRNKNGKKFAVTTITNMMHNRRYIGEYKYRDIVIPDGIPAIVPKELFERVQLRVNTNKHHAGKYKAKEEYILSTKLFCGDCKGFMDGESGNARSGVTYRYYKCINAKRKRGCERKSVKKEWIEDLVLKVVVSYLSDDKFVNGIIKQLLEYQKESNTQLPLLEKQLNKTNTAIENMLTAIEQGIITDSTKVRLQELEDKKKDLELQIMQEKLSKPNYTKEQYLEFFKHSKNLDLTKQRNRKALIDYFVNAIVLYDDKLLFYFNYKPNAVQLSIDELESLSDSLLSAPPRKPPNQAVFRLFMGFFKVAEIAKNQH